MPQAPYHYTNRSVTAKRDLTHVFSRFQIFVYSRTLKCPLHIAFYVLRIGVSVVGSECLISHTFLVEIL